MADRFAPLVACINRVRQVAEKLPSRRGVNEENTKVRLIVPVLAALGWDCSNPDDVEHEYRADKRAKPVDYALMVDGEPVLFVEAKSTDIALDDSKVIRQLLNYGNEAGVGWGVLTNGIEYHIFRTTDVLPPEKRLLVKVSIVEDAPATVATWLMLISKPEMMERRIDRVWETQRVDVTVRKALEGLFDSPLRDGPIVKLVRKSLPKDQTLSGDAIAASMRRMAARLELKATPTPEDLVGGALETGKSARGKASTPTKNTSVDRSDDGTRARRPSILSLLKAGTLVAGQRIYHRSKSGGVVEAFIQKDGTIEVAGRKWPALSSAGAAARRYMEPGKWKGDNEPSTNGWDYWSTDRKDGKSVSIDELTKGPDSAVSTRYLRQI